MAINAIEELALSELSNQVNIKQIQAPAAFESVLMDGISKTNEALNQTEAMAQAAASGESIPTHELMIAMEQAKIELQFALQVRNKLLEVYQEVMRMQV
ncbi:flagellar hook-basal body complex protein FliE [Pseudoalteromonas sp. SMS1]|uniref:flagellar hook-basal body complex protein FliE n=1 Tax=Pseudoalteromonas sp. SMS1 TaxID=2908894 RepID=UPI001F35EC9D|nr:flagellar hook-basal body complex protein FliE [Pseudoalteromonas sp. SMS1]MCF2860221.1 flagellar hook-basal body complex protein FliE [Pseudoalteromonas sp. SMS1]